MPVGRVLLALATILALLAGAGTGSATAGRATATTTIVRVPALEQSLFLRINALRKQNGLVPLYRSTSLSRAAAAHSRAMATFGFFTHESRNGATFATRIQRFYKPRTAGWRVAENLAFASGSITTNLIISSWMASPGHRANLLRGPFREAGIAIVHNPAAGGVFGGEPTWIVTLDIGARS